MYIYIYIYIYVYICIYIYIYIYIYSGHIKTSLSYVPLLTCSKDIQTHFVDQKQVL